MPWEPTALALPLAVALGAVLATAPPAAATVEQDLAGTLSVRLLAASGSSSYLDGGLGKLRFDEEDGPLELGSAQLGYHARLSSTLLARVEASAYDRVDRAVDLAEAYLEWVPVPSSDWRWQGRAGAFHAPFSLENTGRGWSSPYALSSSAINTWLGEELRTVGLQAQATRRGATSGSPHDLGVLAGVFQANDPAGALLSWRGWALHDRQTRLFERLPLAELPIFTDSGLPQEAFEEPFKEIDGRVGWYAGVQWDWLRRSRLRLQRYDNNGDPRRVEDGQWAWDTRFDQLAWHLRLPGGVEALAQVMRGDTRMDGFSGPLVDVEFAAAYLLLTRAWARQRVSLRYDDFTARDEDDFPDDPNDEDGYAWTAAWLLDLPPSRTASKLGAGAWRLGLEAQRVSSERPARRLLGEPTQRDETSAHLALEWRF